MGFDFTPLLVIPIVLFIMAISYPIFTALVIYFSWWWAVGFAVTPLVSGYLVDMWARKT